MEKSISQRLSQWVYDLECPSLTDNVIAAAKRILLDGIACCLGGHHSHDAELARKVVIALGGRPDAGIIGSNDRTNVYNAALLNAIQIRSMDYNDIYWKEDPSHPSDIIPAAIAVGELTEKSGKDLLLAIAIGHEIEEVKVFTIQRAVDILADPTKYHPTEKETADHSLPYCVGVAIIDQMVTPLQFQPERIADQTLIDFIQKIKVEADDELEARFPQLQPSRVEFRIKSGATLSQSLDYAKGDPREPMSDGDLMDKFYGLTKPYTSDAHRRRIADDIANLEKIDRIETFVNSMAMWSGQMAISIKNLNLDSSVVLCARQMSACTCRTPGAPDRNSAERKLKEGSSEHTDNLAPRPAHRSNRAVSDPQRGSSGSNRIRRQARLAHRLYQAGQ